MSEEKTGLASNILARLRGVGTGGVQAPQPQSQQPQPQPQTQSQPQQTVGAVGQAQQEEKPKRDIKELYDFIDAYCSDGEN
jgi:hypothetical protein